MGITELFAYLTVDDADRAIEFYVAAFGAEEEFRLTDASGQIGHAELTLAGTTLMLAEASPEFGLRSPKALGGTPVTIHVHVDNADAVIQKAVDLGATVERKAEDKFYGERSGTLIDPFGHRWNVGQAIEDVTPEEMQRRYLEATGPE